MSSQKEYVCLHKRSMYVCLHKRSMYVCLHNRSMCVSSQKDIIEVHVLVSGHDSPFDPFFTASLKTRVHVCM